jgi:hypothetical protein
VYLGPLLAEALHVELLVRDLDELPAELGLSEADVQAMQHGARVGEGRAMALCAWMGRNPDDFSIDEAAASQAARDIAAWADAQPER